MRPTQPPVGLSFRKNSQPSITASSPLNDKGKQGRQRQRSRQSTQSIQGLSSLCSSPPSLCNCAQLISAILCSVLARPSVTWAVSITQANPRVPDVEGKDGNVYFHLHIVAVILSGGRNFRMTLAMGGEIMTT